MSHSTRSMARCNLADMSHCSSLRYLTAWSRGSSLFCSVDLEVLVEKIGNALFQECLVWQYEVRVREHSGAARCSLNIVLCDPDATELEIVVAANHATPIATFTCGPSHPALSEVCQQLRVDLGQNDNHSLDDGSASTPESAIEAFSEAIAAEVARLGGRDSGPSTIRLSTFPLDADGKVPKYEA